MILCSCSSIAMRIKGLREYLTASKAFWLVEFSDRPRPPCIVGSVWSGRIEKMGEERVKLTVSGELFHSLPQREKVSSRFRHLKINNVLITSPLITSTTTRLLIQLSKKKNELSSFKKIIMTNVCYLFRVEKQMTIGSYTSWPPDKINQYTACKQIFRWKYFLVWSSLQQENSEFIYHSNTHLSISFGHTAQWLYRKYVRWLGTRSFPDTRRSTGYQYWNSCRSLLREQKTACNGVHVKKFKMKSQWSL